MTNAAKVSAALQDVAKRLNTDLEAIAGEKCGFFLFVFAGGEVSYVSTDTDRANIIKAMREIIAKWERGDPDTPAHLRN